MNIVIRGPEGFRRVAENTPFKLAPGEKVVGSERDETEAELNKALAEEGMELGDFIEAAIKLIPEPVRPKHCSKCDKRKLAYNEFSKRGKKIFRDIKQKVLG